MKRTIYKKLVEWKESKLRKPLVLKGARQTGKTYILQVFGNNEFRKSHYINFQKDKNALKIFEIDLTPKNLINSIEFYLDTSINIEQDLVFFDEIQDSPRALTSLKYFCEEMLELAIVCAGSLLCIFRSIPATDYARSRPLIPLDSGYLFRSFRATLRVE